MKIFVYLIFLFNLKLSNSLNFNPLKFSINNIDVGNVRVIQSSNENSEKSIIFFPAKIKKSIPSELYNNFLHNIAENNVKIYIPDDDYDKSSALIKKLQSNKENLTLVSHSSGASKLLKHYSENKNIENIVLIDPINLDEFNEDIKFNTFENLKLPFNFNNNDEINELKSSINELKEIISKESTNDNIKDEKDSYKDHNILVLKSEKSNEWKLFPTVPPINRKELNIDNIKGKKNVIYNKFGHFDILDNSWSDFIHNTVSKGVENRNPVKLNEYHKYLADKIYKIDENNEYDIILDI